MAKDNYGSGKDPAPRTPAPKPSKAFPANEEPRGKTRFGPTPRPAQKTTPNVYNTDPAGKAKPWRDS